MLGKLLRLFGYVFSGGLCLGLIGISLVVLLSGSNNFTLEVVPWWTGRELAKWLLAAGVFGLLATVLAAKGRLPFLQLVWMAVVFGTMVYGFYLTGYKYEDWDHFRSSLQLTGAGATAFLAAITGLFRKSRQQHLL